MINFTWIKKRTIIFIKKKQKNKANKCSDFRPISLLEVLYKILSKLLLEKLNPFYDRHSRLKPIWVHPRSGNVALLVVHANNNWVFKEISPFSSCDFFLIFRVRSILSLMMQLRPLWSIFFLTRLFHKWLPTYPLVVQQKFWLIIFFLAIFYTFGQWSGRQLIRSKV